MAKVRRDSTTVLQHSLVNPQGNGFVERGVRTIEEMVRRIKLDVEARHNLNIEVNHRVIPWIVERCSDLVNRIQVGQDGRTAFERLTGKCCRGEVLPICGPVLPGMSGMVQGGVLAERWFVGLWFGKRFRTEEHINMKLSDVHEPDP